MNRQSKTRPNLDEKTIGSFGNEWVEFDQTALSQDEREFLWQRYFLIFPWEDLSEQAEGFDMGCGSGRWAQLVAPRVGRLNCIDPASDALTVAKLSLAASGIDNVSFFETSADTAPLEACSQDFGYSLGVLHHIPDTAAALCACTDLLKPGAPFLLYLYYRFENRPIWFRAIWRTSEAFRAVVSHLPPWLKPRVTDLLAALVYWPLASLARLFEKLGGNPSFLPLSFYRNASFYTMRTDSRDRFGTPLEQRFTKADIIAMMQSAGLTNIRFSDHEPYWVSIGTKSVDSGK